MPGRPHHCTFAHVALRQLFFESHRDFVGRLLTSKESYLKRLWEQAGERAARSGDARLSDEGLALDISEIDTHRSALIVTLPRPEESGEAYFVAMIVRVPRKSLGGMFSADAGGARYMTLEYSPTLTGHGTETQFCEWVGDNHQIYGNGPPPTIDAFRERLSKLLGAPFQPVASLEANPRQGGTSPSGRTRMRVLLLAVVVALCVVAYGLYGYFFPRPVPPARGQKAKPSPTRTPGPTKNKGRGGSVREGTRPGSTAEAGSHEKWDAVGSRLQEK